MIYVEINGVEQRGLSGVGITSVRVQQSLQNRNTAEVSLIVTNNATSYSEGQQIDIGNGATRYFVGTIANLRKAWLNPVPTQHHGAEPKVLYDLQCVSFDQIASRRYIVQTSGPVLPLVYTDTSAGAIMRDVATQFLGGENVSLTGVLDGPTFSSFSVAPGAKVYDVFDAIADNAGMYWDILGAPNVPALRLYARGSLPSGWSLGVTSPIVCSGAGGESGISVQIERANLSNEVYVAISEGPGNPTTQDFLGDGSSRDFSTDKPIDSQPTIKVDGVEKAVSIKNYIAADWYWTPGSPTVEQDVSQPVLTGANTLSVEYTPRENIVVLGAKDDANITARSLLESTSGRYQAVISAADGSTIATAAVAAAAYLDAHKNPAQQLAIRSFDAQAEALSIGQTIAVNLPPLGVNATFLVESVTRSYEGRHQDGADAILHVFTLSTGSVIGDWVTKFASAWSVGGGGGATAGAVVQAAGAGRATVQDLGTLTADTTVTPSPSSPVDGDLLIVTWSLASTIYTLTWGSGFAATAKADYRPRTPSSHAYFFAYLVDQWTLISWRTDI